MVSRFSSTSTSMSLSCGSGTSICFLPSTMRRLFVTTSGPALWMGRLWKGGGAEARLRRGAQAVVREEVPEHGAVDVGLDRLRVVRGQPRGARDVVDEARNLGRLALRKLVEADEQRRAPRGGDPDLVGQR